MKDRIRITTLVIDDDPSVCAQVQTWLSAEAFEVQAFTDPIAAVRHAAENPCELALVDLRMPDTDTPRLVRKLLEQSNATRVVVMAAFPEADSMQRALAAGARDSIRKPLDRGELLALLERELGFLGVAGRTEKHFNRRLGVRLRELRRAANRTQHEIARRAGITPAQLSQIELGKTATTTWTLARICGAMKMPLHSVFDRL